MVNPMQDIVKEAIGSNAPELSSMKDLMKSLNDIAAGKDPLAEAYNSLSAKIAEFSNSPLPTAAPSPTETPSLDEGNKNTPSPLR